MNQNLGASTTEPQQKSAGWNGHSIGEGIENQVEEILQKGKSLIKTHPVEASLVGLGVGLLIGMWLTKRK